MSPFDAFRPQGRLAALLPSCSRPRHADCDDLRVAKPRGFAKKRSGLGRQREGGRAGDGECEDGERAGGIGESFAYFTFRLFSVLFTHLLLFFPRALKKKKK